MKMNKKSEKEYASLKIEKDILLLAKMLCLKKRINIYEYASRAIEKQNKLEAKKEQA